MTPANQGNWERLLVDAVNTPGKISRAYSLFHNYSMGNALEALSQCAARGIEPGPINSYLGWKELGRQVRKGERAIFLWMPITCKRKDNDTNTGEEGECTFTRFVYKPHWFVLAQTDGPTVASQPIPDFDVDSALENLGIPRIPFDLTDGNTQGFATKAGVAVSPIAHLPVKTLFHELGHHLLGHIAENTLTDGQEPTPRDLREVEAEGVALICCESLGIDGAEFCRGYVQHWARGNPIPEKSAQKIFSAATSILKAGRKLTSANC
jgi:antirestriction protein ArdC